jgi:hypothetical protein
MRKKLEMPENFQVLADVIREHFKSHGIEYREYGVEYNPWWIQLDFHTGDRYKGNRGTLSLHYTMHRKTKELFYVIAQTGYKTFLRYDDEGNPFIGREVVDGISWTIELHNDRTVFDDRQFPAYSKEFMYELYEKVLKVCNFSCLT